MVVLVLAHINTEWVNVRIQHKISCRFNRLTLFYLDGQYGSYYNQYPGSSSFYQNYGSGYRPNQYSSNYYPSSGSYYGGYFWNSSSKNHLNKCTLFLSSLFTLIIYVITKWTQWNRSTILLTRFLFHSTRMLICVRVCLYLLIFCKYCYHHL